MAKAPTETEASVFVRAKKVLTLAECLELINEHQQSRFRKAGKEEKNVLLNSEEPQRS